MSATLCALNFNPCFSKISLSGLVFDRVAALFGFALCLLFVQKLLHTQAWPLSDADSVIRADLKSCLKRSTS